MEKVAASHFGATKVREDRLVTLDFEEAAFSALRVALYIYSMTEDSSAELSELSERFKLIGCFEGLYHFSDRTSFHTFTVSNLGEIYAEASEATAECSVGT